MHRLWHIPELLVQIVLCLPASDIDQAFHVSHHFRTVLKANLLPHLRPLPDHPREKPGGSRSLPQDLCDKAKAFGIYEASLPAELMMTDTYFHWREAARYDVLGALKSCLHPVLGRYATYLIDGYEALAEKKMDMRLQTKIPYCELYEMINVREPQDWCERLAVKPLTVVTVICLSVPGWDLSYANVQRRCYVGVERYSVRIERKDGLRMGDVLDELRGSLVGEKVPDALGQDVVLVWEMKDHEDAIESS